MKFILEKKYYLILKEYADFSNLSLYLLNEENSDKVDLIVDKNEISEFFIRVSDMIDIYGFGVDDEITSFGRELEAIYDMLYNQIKAPD